MTRLLVGTDDGLFVVDEDAGAWRITSHLLADREINGVAPIDAHVALVAARNEGLFRIDLDDTDMVPVGADRLPKIVRTITISPHDPRLVLVGTEPAAIYASEDGGNLWRELSAVSRLRTEKRWKYPVPTIGDHIRHIVIDRDSPKGIYAAVQVGGIIRSEDGGSTWTHVADGLDPDVHTLLQHPLRPDVLYAVCGGGGYPGEPGEETPYPPPFPQGRPIYRSHDRGTNWECISRGFSRTYGVPMQYVRDGSLTLYSAVARGIPPMWVSRAEKADAVLIESHDDGESWIEVRGGLPKRFPDMIEAIVVDPADGRRLFIATGGEGMKMLPESERNGRIFRSDAAIRRWARIPIDFPSIFTLTAI